MFGNRESGSQQRNRKQVKCVSSKGEQSPVILLGKGKVRKKHYCEWVCSEVALV